MSIDLAVDVDALYDAITAGIKKQFPALLTVEFFREDRKTIPLPACLLDAVEMEREGEADSGTGQIPMRVKFEAELIVGFRDLNCKREVRKLAAAMAAFLHLRRWPGVYADPCMVHGSYKDDFSPELDQYEVQRIEWTQLCYFGTDVWDCQSPPPIPQHVFYGFTPKIGEGHLQDYIELLP